MKRCFKCGKDKDLSCFYKHKAMADGHLNKCKECAKADVRRNREENPRPREYDRSRYHTNPERRKKTSDVARDWARRNPEKRKAQWTLGNAVRDGRVKKHPCELCGRTDVEAHHYDYSRPLDVMWLCKTHHREFHLKK